MAVRVLVVCTGNVCRSPLVERVLVRELGDVARVVSAGTQALVGEPMTARTAELVREAGGDPAGHVARQLDEALLDEVDLVLTATRAHRSTVLQMRPALLRRTFTVREAGRLADAVGGRLVGESCEQRFRDLIAMLPGARGELPVTDVRLDDVDDPFGRDRGAYAKTASQAAPAVRALAAAVRGRTVG